MVEVLRTGEAIRSLFLVGPASAFNRLNVMQHQVEIIDRIDTKHSSSLEARKMLAIAKTWESKLREVRRASEGSNL
jgi:hypothetical protein